MTDSASESIEKCRECALRLLERRPHSRAELERKLRERDYPAPVRQLILADFERVGLVNDRQFTEAFVRQKLLASRPVGTRRILFDLRRRGISEEMARAVLAEVTEEDNEEGELERARQAASTKWASLMRSGREIQKARAAVYRFLAGRGFDGDVIRRAVEELERDDLD
jgi:regulatory protein